MTMPSPFAICIFAIVMLGTLGLPIGHSMIAGSILYLLLMGLDLGTAAEQILNGLFNSYVLLAIPLFILAADLMNIGSLTDRLLQFCLVLVGRFRGGLGHVNVVANMIFAGMSGSAIADAVGIGRIIIGMMSKDGRYPVAYAGAITASAAIIGPIIPPSIPMVLYALISDTSIGYLFLGGFVPGVMLGITFMAANAIIARRRNYPVEPPIPARDIPSITLRAFPALMLPVILLFGIYGGVMTPTEGAAAAAFYALFASTVLYRAVTWRQLYDALLTSGKATTSIGMLIAGALIFNYVVTVENIPASLARMLAGQDFSAAMFLLVVNVILIVLGCLLEGSTILLVVVPIFIPTAKALGIDLVHFGVVVVVNIMIGLLTPPYGLLLFVLANMTKQPLGAIVREALPFIVMAIMVLAIITAIPDSIRGCLVCGGTKAEGVSRMKSIYVLNGPNLNRLGKREPAIYGKATLADVERDCREEAGDQAMQFRQSNSEAEIIGSDYEAIDEGAGIIINPAAFTFTSIAILDALKMFEGPIIELHISNIHKREPYYHHSYISKVATAVIAGLGAEGYRIATRAMKSLLK